MDFEVFMTKRLANMSGVGLIEVLVTMLLLSTALLTFASLQTRSLQYNQGAYLRSQANILAYDMLDRIRVNKDNMSDYLIPFSSSSSPGASLASVDISSWLQDISSRLPSGEGAITCVAVPDRICTVTIRWGELNSAGETNGDTTSFEYRSRIPN